MIALLLAHSLPSAATFQVDGDRSEIVAVVEVTGIASPLAHDHVVRADEMRGHVRFDGGQPGATAVEIVVDATALAADETGVRDRYGLDKEISAENRRRVEERLKGEDQLAVEQYPRIVFTSSGAEPLGAGRHRLNGTIEIHGTSRPLQFPATIEVSQDELSLEATFSVAQTAFGIAPYRVALGAIRSKDEVSVHVSLHAERVPTEACR